MKNIVLLIAFIPLIVLSQKAPWGISTMQCGVKISYYKTLMAESENWNQTNYSFGPTGRLQSSFLDFFVYGDQKFRIVDVFGFEAGMGYQRSKTIRNDEYFKDVYINKKVWYDFGVDLGILAKFRVHPDIDLGVKYMYLSQVNSTFNYVGSHSAYGNALNWAFSARYDKFYVDLTLVKGNKTYPQIVNILDIKYRFENEGSWASYFGLQIGRGKSVLTNDVNDFVATKSRNWIQFTIGKMTNF